MLSKKGLTELAKSLGRFLWFGALALLVEWLRLTFTGDQFNEATVLVVGLIIKAIDRYRHTSDKTESKGIAPKFLQG